MNRRSIIKFISSNKGLTLIEILVTASLIAFITVLVLRNFNYSRLNLDRVANVMASDIRLAQQLALSAHKYQGPNDLAPQNRCGYGITPDPNSIAPQQAYIVYAGLATVKSDGVTANNCPGGRQYQASQDTPAYKTVILDSRIDFRDNSGQGQIFKDIYFEPPGLSVYFQNTGQTIDQCQHIVIKKVGVALQGGPAGSSCQKGNPNCIYIDVYGSGRVEVSNNFNSCP